MLRLRLRHWVSHPAERQGHHEEWHGVAPSDAALLLVNLYGWLLPEEHPARSGLAAIYGRTEVMRREAIVRQSILPVLAAARNAQMPVVYVADSAPNLALEHTQIRDVACTHLGYDPLAAYAEMGNDPREYVPGDIRRIAFAPDLEPREGDYYVRKWVYSGFHGTWLDRLLRDLGTRMLFCAGFNGESDLFCTMLEGGWAGYRMVLVRDCHAAVHIPAYEPAMDMTRRLELYAESNLGFSIAPADLIAACRQETGGEER